MFLWRNDCNVMKLQQLCQFFCKRDTFFRILFCWRYNKVCRVKNCIIAILHAAYFLTGHWVRTNKFYIFAQKILHYINHVAFYPAYICDNRT